MMGGLMGKEKFRLRTTTDSSVSPAATEATAASCCDAVIAKAAAEVLCGGRGGVRLPIGATAVCGGKDDQETVDSARCWQCEMGSRSRNAVQAVRRSET